MAVAMWWMQPTNTPTLSSRTTPTVVARADGQASTFDTTPVRRSSSYSVSSRLTTRMSR